MERKSVAAIPVETIRAARDGARIDVDRLVEAAWPHAYRIARSIVGDPAYAEEAAQESCAIVYQRIHSLRSVEAFHVWFYRIVMREALALAQPADEARDLENGRLAGNPSDVDARIDVVSALAALAPEQRAAIVLRYYAGMNSREIAVTLGVPDGTVRFHIMLAKRALQKVLSEYRNRSRGERLEVAGGV